LYWFAPAAASWRVSGVVVRVQVRPPLDTVLRLCLPARLVLAYVELVHPVPVVEDVSGGRQKLTEVACLQCQSNGRCRHASLPPTRRGTVRSSCTRTPGSQSLRSRTACRTR